MNFILLALLPMAFLQISPAAETDVKMAPAEWRVYIGTYTGGKSEGIYQLRLETATGKIENLGLAVAVDNPSFLAIHPKLDVLYSVGQGEDAAGENKGLVSAFNILQEEGRLSLLNQQSTVGEGPCHVTVDPQGLHALAANYNSGSIVVLPLAEDGSLRASSDFEQHAGSSVHPQRQQGPHAHAVALDPAGKHAFVVDLGLDKIMVYSLDAAKGLLEPGDPAFAALAPGSGPRHFAFHPSGRFAYVVNELGNTVTAFIYGVEAGKLEELQTIGTLPKSFSGENTTAEIRVHPSGRFLYASNRGHDSIACFAIDTDTGRLTSAGQVSTLGKVPRNFNVSPDGLFLLAANQQSGNVVVFRINPESGIPEYTGYEAEVPTPVCVLFYDHGNK